MAKTKQPLQDILDNVNEKLVFGVNEVSSLQAQLTTLNGMLQTQINTLDRNVHTKLTLEEGESNLTLQLELTNLKTGDSVTIPIDVPISDFGKAGLMDAVMFQAFKDMQDSITAILSQIMNQPRIAVVSGLENDEQETLTKAFTAALGSAPVVGDRLINVDNQTEWIFDSEDEWIMLSAIPMNLASATNDGIVTHSELEGTVGYYVAGVGQVNGWDALKNLVNANASNISIAQSAITAANNRLNSHDASFSAIMELLGYTHAFLEDWLDIMRVFVGQEDLLYRDIDTFGSLGSDSGKWEGGVLAPNGKIYGIPHNSTAVLEIDPASRTATTFGSLSDSGKWIGGVLAPNGKIYGIPCNSTAVLEIDPASRTATTFGSLSGSYKWIGGVLAPNGKIYGIPYYSTAVLEISTDDDIVNFAERTLLGTFLNKF